jgi:signal transduction histidine kinase
MRDSPADPSAIRGRPDMLRGLFDLVWRYGRRLGERVPKKPTGLRRVLIISFLLLSVTILITTSFLYILGSFQYLQTFVTVRQRLVAEGAAETVRAFVGEKIDALERTVAIAGIANASEKQQKLALERLLGKESSFRQTVLLSAERRERVRISRLSKSLSIQTLSYDADEVIFAAERGKTYIGPVYIDKISGEPMLVVAVPVMDVFGDIKGTLAAELNLKSMWDLMENLKVGNRGLAYVVDKRGDLIAFKDIGRVLKGENLTRLEEVASFVEKKGGNRAGDPNIVRGIQNTWVVSAHIDLVVPDWAVVVELPLDEAYESVVTWLKLSGGMVVLIFVLAVLSSMYLSKRITGPIMKLRDAAGEIGKGNLDTKIEILSKDEIGELAVSFNRMTEDLKESRRQIEIYSKTLEQKVEERTKELQESQKRLLQSEKMAAVGQLAAGVAHEINNPMAVILGFARGIARAVEEGEPLYLPARSIEREAERCKNIVRDLLMFSRAGKRDVAKEEMNAIVDETLLLVRSGAKAKSVRIETNFGANLAAIMVDKNQIQQVIVNICNNAMDAMSEGGVLTITTRQGGDYVETEIADTGAGMTEEVRRHIFEPFFTTKPLGKGTGLGLSISYEIIERHNGRIEVTSGLGRGTTFRIMLPVAA